MVFDFEYWHVMLKTNGSYWKFFTLKLVSSVILTNFKFDKYPYEMRFWLFCTFEQKGWENDDFFVSFLLESVFLKFSTFHGQIEIEQRVQYFRYCVKFSLYEVFI